MIFDGILYVLRGFMSEARGVEKAFACAGGVAGGGAGFAVGGGWGGCWLLFGGDVGVDGGGGGETTSVFAAGHYDVSIRYVAEYYFI